MSTEQAPSYNRPYVDLKSLGLEQEQDLTGRYYWVADTPIGRREVELTTVNFVPVISYIDPEDGSLLVKPVPGIHKELITRGHTGTKAGFSFEER